MIMLWEIIFFTVACIIIILIPVLVTYNIIPQTASTLTFSREMLLRPNYQNQKLPVENPTQTNTIPLILFQTYHNIEKIPKKVYENIKTYACDYQHIIFDDAECVSFLAKYYHKTVTDTFHLLKGAHKADLFRYCILYIYGGIYMDIKTQLIHPISEIVPTTTFTKPMIYSVLSSDLLIYNGIIASTPRNPIFMDLIYQITQHGRPFDYFSFIKYFTQSIEKDTNSQIHVGANFGSVSDYYLFSEVITKNPEDCVDGLDRYGFCSQIYDTNQRNVFKTRYSDFPW